MKKTVIAVCSLVLTVLALCTVLSVQVERLMTAEINVVRASKAGIRDAVTGEEREYADTLPQAALLGDEGGDYVLALEKTDGVWGEEHTVRRLPVTLIEAMDGNRFASEALAYHPNGFALYPSHPLQDGETVQVRGN